MEAITSRLAGWARNLRYEDLPPDVVDATRWRVLDVVGLALAGADTPFGRSVRQGAVALNRAERGRLLGSGEVVGVPLAAFVNGALSQALEYDDTHNESIVHISGPSVAAALALSEQVQMTGREMILAVAIGNEISARLGSIAPGQLHHRGYHPTGIFAPFGVAFLAGRVLGLDEARLAAAAGIVGSFAAGLLQCWVDGTQSKFLHPGWAAQSGIVAASLAGAGTTGPAEVVEGRFGLIRSHLQDPEAAPDFGRADRELGTLWESRRASFKPFPAAHVIHPYIDAVLALRARHGLAPEMVEEIRCPVPGYFVPIVCEPVAEKRRPKTDSHGRVSFHYSLAEALVRGRLGKDAYSEEARNDPAILAIADRVACMVDPAMPGPEQFKGVVEIRLTDGRLLRHTEEHNRGSLDNPMTPEELWAKFAENAGCLLPEAGVRRLGESILALDTAAEASRLVSLSIAADGAPA